MFVSLCRAVKLAYDVVGGTQSIDHSPVIILHGLFGSKSNWATMAKKIHRETLRTVSTCTAWIRYKYMWHCLLHSQIRGWFLLLIKIYV